MTIDEAIIAFENRLRAARAVIDSGFGTNPGESNYQYVKEKEMAEIALEAIDYWQEKFPPPCYQEDIDGCAYQIHGDNDDEPIDQCKKCPLCYSDKVRKKASNNDDPLSIQDLYDNVNSDNPYPVWIYFPQVGYTCPGVIDLRYEIIAVIGADENTCYLYEKDYGVKWLAFRDKPIWKGKHI